LTENASWVRVWKGRTSAAHFEQYSEYLHEHGVRKIQGLPNNLGVTMWRRLDGDVADFVVTSYWPSLESIKAWAGEDITKTRFLENDPIFLVSLEAAAVVDHYELYSLD
jgi:heme-degrading monooxygenase HmoA